MKQFFLLLLVGSLIFVSCAGSKNDSSSTLGLYFILSGSDSDDDDSKEVNKISVDFSGISENLHSVLAYKEKKETADSLVNFALSEEAKKDGWKEIPSSKKVEIEKGKKLDLSLGGVVSLGEKKIDTTTNLTLVSVMGSEDKVKNFKYLALSLSSTKNGKLKIESSDLQKLKGKEVKFEKSYTDFKKETVVVSALQGKTVATDKEVNDFSTTEKKPSKTDDPKTPTFDEIKQKIEKTIKFPAKNENKILSNTNDYKSVDFSITGEFFQDLEKLEKLQLEHQVFAGSENTSRETVKITNQFLTDKKIPLTLDISSLQPDNGFAQPKVKLKFSSNDKQIISKEWTQNFFLKGKTQTVLFIGTDNKEIPQGILLEKSTTVKIKPKGNFPLPIRVEASSQDVSGKDDAGDFTVIDIPTKDKTNLKEKDLPLALTGDAKLYLVKARVFFRPTDSENWQPLSETLYQSYSLNSPEDYTIKLDKTIVRTGEDIKFTIEKLGGTVNEFTLWNFDRSGDRFVLLNNDGSITKDRVGLDWTGKDYFGDIIRGTGNLSDGYQFTLKGVKRNIVLYVGVKYIEGGRPGPMKKQKIKIMVRP